MQWITLMRNARVSRELLSYGNPIATVVSFIEMGLIDNDEDEELCPHLRWEIKRLETWQQRKPFVKDPVSTFVASDHNEEWAENCCDSI